MEIADYLVVGSGISGLVCATELTAAGKSVLVVDKGRGPGGRMSTRRMAGGRLDHGAQYFTVRDERFQKYVDKWLSAGIVREWFRHLPEDSDPNGYPRYCGIDGMSSVPKALAAKLSVALSEQVIELVKDVDCWVARTASGDAFSGRHLVLSAPLPQSLALLDTTGLDYAGEATHKLKQIQYEKGLATLLVLEGPSGLDAPGGIKVESPILTWIGDNQMKGISTDVSTVTLHATAEFADKHWDSTNEVRGPLMIEAARPFITAEVVESTCHRWGFTTVNQSWPDRYFHNEGLRFTLIGDAFGEPRVEGAVLSAIEGAERLLK